MPSPSLKLPVDVLFTVLDFAADDADLRTCAMVHSTWTRPSQARLFRSVVVNGRERSWPRLLVILNTSPHIRPFIRALSIRANALDGGFVPTKQIALLFPRVGHILLEFFSRQDGLKLLAGFPALKTLALSMASSDVDFPADELYRVKLEKLDIFHMCHEYGRTMSLRGALNFLVSSVTTRTLRVLRIDLSAPEDYPLLRVALNALVSMEELQMEVRTNSLAQIGALPLRHDRFFVLTGRGAGFDLGKIHVKVLQLIMHWNTSPTVMGAFLLLKHTAFPRMVELGLMIHESLPLYTPIARLECPREYHPFGRLWNTETGPDPREWELTPVLAQRLKRVHVEFYRRIPCRLFQTQAFFRLFGPANNPSVLKFVPNEAKVVD
jgi:hypothetical protein